MIPLLEVWPAGCAIVARSGSKGLLGLDLKTPLPTYSLFDSASYLPGSSGTGFA